MDSLPVINGKSTLGYLLFGLALLILLSLGVWQTQRGLGKQHVLSLVGTEHKINDIRSIPVTDPLRLAYQPARLHGRWDSDHSFLLMNRMHTGQPGYEVLTPFRLAEGGTLMVNRGWLPEQKPDIPAPTGVPQGTLYLPGKGFTLGPAILPQALAHPAWPLKSLYLDPDAFSHALNTVVSPLVLVLNADDPDSFTRIWSPVIMTPTRHFGYAVQWFALALVLLIFGIIWRRKGKHTKETERI
ncbi:MAG: SURF1 family protein [Thiothrix sp.]|nr:SURF1 family protein [Thiothrix sp.]HPQ94637.1 SURF1 family protein [Thiolinea sp.]